MTLYNNNSPLILNAGWLSGLVDLNTEKDNVQYVAMCLLQSTIPYHFQSQYVILLYRERIAAYLTDLISIGFSGFRVDAAKHIKPDDLLLIFGKLRRNLGIPSHSSLLRLLRVTHVLGMDMMVL
jgi:alpha-amylase